MNLEQLQSETEKKQLQLIPQIANDGEDGLDLLMRFLQTEIQLTAKFSDWQSLSNSGSGQYDQNR